MPPGKWASHVSPTGSLRPKRGSQTEKSKITVWLFDTLTRHTIRSVVDKQKAKVERTAHKPHVLHRNYIFMRAASLSPVILSARHLSRTRDNCALRFRSLFTVVPRSWRIKQFRSRISEQDLLIVSVRLSSRLLEVDAACQHLPILESKESKGIIILRRIAQQKREKKG